MRSLSYYKINVMRLVSFSLLSTSFLNGMDDNRPHPYTKSLTIISAMGLTLQSLNTVQHTLTSSDCYVTILPSCPARGDYILMESLSLIFNAVVFAILLKALRNFPH